MAGMIPLSVLDLSPVPEGADVSRSLSNTLDLARHAERLGFNRYWLAEHHNMPGIASAATSVVIGAVAAATKTIRVGAGGVMLPNHAPYVIAEQLGSSTFGAQLAAHLGLPYAFASHFAPAEMTAAIRIYRETFRPSDQLAEPYVMLGYNVFAAETDEAAQEMFSSVQQSFVNLRSGQPGKLPAPKAGYADGLDAGARAMIDSALACSAVGSPEVVRGQLADFIARTQPDEIMVTTNAFDHARRVRSFEILAEVAAA